MPLFNPMVLSIWTTNWIWRNKVNVFLLLWTTCYGNKVTRYDAREYNAHVRELRNEFTRILGISHWLERWYFWNCNPTHRRNFSPWSNFLTALILWKIVKLQLQLHWSFFKSVQFIFPGFDCTKNGKIRIQDFVRLVQPQPQSIGMFWLFH